jgi:osmotically-inducible protein OsmY
MRDGNQQKKGFAMFKRNLMVASLTAAATFAGLTLSAFATDDPKAAAAIIANTEVHDAALTEKIETLLRTDVGLAGSQFRILTKSAVVTVGGTVPDEHALRRALDLASGVRGVREVRNTMEVDSPK